MIRHKDPSPAEAPADEIWRFIPEHPSIEISNYGRARAYISLDMGSRTFRYPRIELAGTRQTVHRWVARLFIGPCPKGMVVNHKDNNPKNNYVGNLEYVTQQENLRLGPHTKLTPDLVRAIRRDFAAGGVTKVALGKKYGIGDHQIGCVILGRQWGDIT